MFLLFEQVSSELEKKCGPVSFAVKKTNDGMFSSL
jgi:hypothetical protein